MVAKRQTLHLRKSIIENNNKKTIYLSVVLAVLIQLTRSAGSLSVTQDQSNKQPDSTNMDRVFDQVREAEELLKKDKEGVILIIGDDKNRESVMAAIRGDEHIVDSYAIIELRPPSEDIRWGDKGASAWISRNSLRKLNRCSMKVVWVVSKQPFTTSGTRIMMATIFEKCMKSTLMITTRSSNTWFPGIPLVGPTFKTMPIHLFGANVIKDMPFSEVVAQGMWSSEKIVLLGRTGSGKSTVAQMLTSGKLDSASKFVLGSSSRGVTMDITREDARGWHVTDTPGFGEAKGGSVPTSEALNRIVKFVKNVSGIYSHFIYVFRWDRLTVYDERLWEFFNQLFSRAENNFTIIATCKEEDLSDEERTILKQKFNGCKSFICVDFCAEDSNPGVEEENVDIRNESLMRLERELASLGHREVVCNEGVMSVEHITHVSSKLFNLSKHTPVDALGVLRSWFDVIYHLTTRSKIDENIVLLPQ